MPDTPPASPAEPQGQPPAPPAQPPAEPPAAQTPREQITDKYNRLYAPPEPPAAEPVPAPSAPAEPAPDPNARLVELVEQLNTRIAELEQRAQKPAEPAEPPKVPEAQKNFLDLLREGKVQEAQDLIARQAAEQAAREAEERSIERYRMETQINEFITDLRGKNPDILPLEELVAARAQGRIEKARTEGKIKTTADFIEVYKAAVLAETEEARKIVQHLRAAGKQEGLTVKEEVLSSGAVPPSPANREPASAEPKMESVSDYIAKRSAEARQRQGRLINS